MVAILPDALQVVLDWLSNKEHGHWLMNAVMTRGDSYEDLEERPRQGRYKGEARHRLRQKDSKYNLINPSIRRVKPLRALNSK